MENKTLFTYKTNMMIRYLQEALMFMDTSIKEFTLPNTSLG